MQILSLFILLFINSCGGSGPDSSPTSFSFLQTLDDFNLPGILSAFYQDGSYKEINVAGVKRFGTNSPLNSDSKFHLASNTKAMTATLAAIMVEEGLITWKTTLKDIFEPLAIHSDFQNITFDMLFAHRSGMRRDPTGSLYSELVREESSGMVLRKKVAETYLKSSAEFSAGSFNYSNTGYIIIGHILEKLTGKSWETLMLEKLFSPLKMDSCNFGPTSDPAQPLLETWGHYMKNGTPVPIHKDSPMTYGPAGTVHCTIHDWAKFMDIHLRGFKGEDSLITKESFNKLHTLYPASGSTYTYGGWGRVSRSWAGGTTLIHDGTNGYNFSRAWLVPHKNGFIISVTNVGGMDANNGINNALQALIDKHLTP